MFDDGERVELRSRSQVSADLLQGMKEIFNNESKSKEMYIKLYTLVYNNCTNLNIDQLTRTHNEKRISYFQAGTELYTLIQDFLKNYAMQVLERAEDYADEAFLRFYTQQWADYESSGKLLDRICAYLNEIWMTWIRDKEGHQGFLPIHQLVLLTWRDSLFYCVQQRLTAAVLKLIDQERRGQIIDTGLIDRVKDAFLEMGFDFNTEANSLSVYQQSLERDFLMDSRQFYAGESARFLHYPDVTAYVTLVERRLNEEQQRVKAYLDSTTLEKIVSVTRQMLITPHLDRFRDELRRLLNAGSRRELCRILTLVSGIEDGHAQLLSGFEQEIVREGRLAVERAGQAALSDPCVYATTVLEVRRRYTAVIAAVSGNHAAFVSALDRACKAFINCNAVTQAGGSSSKSAQLLAKYCHLVLKNPQEVGGGAQLEDWLDRVVDVLIYVDDKDVFERVYGRLLARRLLHNTQLQDAEKLLISRLKQVCGSQYVSSLERMLQDMADSRDVNQRFTDSQKPAFDLHFSVQVLSSRAWPLQQSLQPFSLPSQLELSFGRFADFYRSQHSGRKLICLAQLSKGELVTNCFVERYTLQVVSWFHSM